MTANLRQAAGSLLVVGLGGTELTGLERAWLKLVRPAGIILFRRNIADARQTRALLDEATDLCASTALRCVDVEGGTVDRLRDALAPMPSAQAVARAATATGKNALTQRARRVGRAAREGLRLQYDAGAGAGPGAAGSPPRSWARGCRIHAGRSGGICARFSRRTLPRRAWSVAASIFPGSAAARWTRICDTPIIQRNVARALGPGPCPLSRTAQRTAHDHGESRGLSGDAGRRSIRPAYRAYWITTVLRKRIGYRGIIFSDDLEMGGILKFMPIEEAALAALRAGMDLLEICHSPELILRAYEALIAEGERSTAFREVLLERAARTSRQTRQAVRRRSCAALYLQPNFEALRTRILRFSDTIRNSQPLPGGASGMSAKAMTVAGIMSGTSADGIDVAVVRIAPGSRDSARPRLRLLAHEGFAFPPALRRAVLAAMNALCNLNRRAGAAQLASGPCLCRSGSRNAQAAQAQARSDRLPRPDALSSAARSLLCRPPFCLHLAGWRSAGHRRRSAHSRCLELPSRRYARRRPGCAAGSAARLCALCRRQARPRAAEHRRHRQPDRDSRRGRSRRG